MGNDGRVECGTAIASQYRGTWKPYELMKSCGLYSSPISITFFIHLKAMCDKFMPTHTHQINLIYLSFSISVSCIIDHLIIKAIQAQIVDFLDKIDQKLFRLFPKLNMFSVFVFVFCFYFFSC